MKSLIVSWSGGKDCTLALYKLNKLKYKVQSLLSTVSAQDRRINMHYISFELLKIQANSIGLPIHIIDLPDNTTNIQYNEIMEKEMLNFKFKGIKYVMFGDIFLEDIRKYRELNLSKVGMECIFPLWMKNTSELAKEFLDLGFKAIITSLDSTKLNRSYIGKNFNEKLLQSLPKGVDFCGENGEFHTFVYDGPIFSFPISFLKGHMTVRDNRFYYIDLIPKGSQS